MATVLPPPPTWAPLVSKLGDQPAFKTDETFNTEWLSWFLQVAALVNHVTAPNSPGQVWATGATTSDLPSFQPANVIGGTPDNMQVIKTFLPPDPAIIVQAGRHAEVDYAAGGYAVSINPENVSLNLGLRAYGR